MFAFFTISRSAAVVTGSTAGIGLEYTKQLAAAGFNVFMIARDSTKLEETAQIIKQASSSTLTKTHAIDLAHATDAQFSSLASELKDLEVGVLSKNRLPAPRKMAHSRYSQ